MRLVLKRQMGCVVEENRVEFREILGREEVVLITQICGISPRPHAEFNESGISSGNGCVDKPLHR